MKEVDNSIGKLDALLASEKTKPKGKPRKADKEQHATFNGAGERVNRC